MLCPQCNERQATVHFTLMTGASADEREFCEPCFSAPEAERLKAFNSRPSTPPPADIENITAPAFLELLARAGRNGADKSAFKFICNKLEQFPKSRERLTFEILELMWQVLERGEDPTWEEFYSTCWRQSIDAGSMPIYVMWLERTIDRCFELRNQRPSSNPDYSPFEKTLSNLLLTLWHVDRHRFRAVIEQLKSQCSEDDLQTHWKMLPRIEQMVLDLENNCLPDSKEFARKWSTT